MALSTDLTNAELWPIQAKGKVMRLTPLGDPTIAKYYQKSMEEGRILENSIADANDWLLKKKQKLYADIASYMRLQSIATNSQLKYKPRVLKLIQDVAQTVQAINTIKSELQDLELAMIQNITTLATIEKSLIQMVQTAINSLANLMQQICNWGLPPLASIPNLLPEGLWSWNGFNFSPLNAFKNLKLTTPSLSAFQNFSFSQCSLLSLGLVNNPVGNNPLQVLSYSGNNFGTEPSVLPAPLAGMIIENPTPAQLSQTSTPIYNIATFNPNTSMIGSLPDPSTILSDYQLPASVYQANILSLISSTLNQVIEPDDPDYANPNYNVRNPQETKSLAANITLAAVVASGFDPYVVSAWLFYLGLNFTGRAGVWITNFAQIYAGALAPSIASLSTNPVPFNNFSGTVVKTPTDIPFTDLMQSLPLALQQNLLWKLSYIEASLLGYTRNKTWDSGADTLYVANYTGTDLDYAVTLISQTTVTVVLGQGTAQYPVPCTFPTSIATVMNEVIALATTNIQNTPGYLSPHPQYRYVYDQFAQATMVDRYSQFWREFNNNVIVLLTTDPYVLQRVVSYSATLDGAVDPLADQTIYNQLIADCQIRNRTWTPGVDLLNIPIAPIVQYNNPAFPVNNGWSGTTFDNAAFLSRPDIQSLPIPTQIAMLRTNISYAGVKQYQQQVQNEIATQMANLNAAVAAIAQLGFFVTAVVDTVIPAGVSGAAVNFEIPPFTQPSDFDLTDNVTNPNTFTLQNAGVYAISGQMNWGASGLGTFIITVTCNGVAIYQTEQTGTGPFSQQFMYTGGFDIGDVIQVIASTSLASATTVVPGSFFTMILTNPIATGPAVSITPLTTGGSATKSFMADSTFPELTAVVIQSDGGVNPVNITSVVLDSTSTPPWAIIAPYLDGISTDPATNGQLVDVATNYGGEYQVITSPPLNWTPGGLLYVKPDGTLTQDFDHLTLGTYGTLAWIVCVGRATASDTFIYEPHIPVQTIAVGSPP